VVGLRIAAIVVAIESLISIPFLVAASAIGLVVAVALALAAWTITGMQTRAIVSLSKSRAAFTRAQTAQADLIRAQAREQEALAEAVRTESALAFASLADEVIDLRAELDEINQRASDWLMPRRVADPAKSVSLVLPLVQSAVASADDKNGEQYAVADRDLAIDIVREISLLDGESLPERQIVDLAGIEVDDATGRRLSA
jgi:hypothetical protein